MLRGGGLSQWMRLLPPHNSLGGHVYQLARGILARQQGRALRDERMVQNPDLIQAVISLSAVAGGLSILDNKMYMNENQLRHLIIKSFGPNAMDVDDITVPFELEVNGLWNPWPVGFPVQPDANGLICINPAHLAVWITDVYVLGTTTSAQICLITTGITTGSCCQ
ncbi:hypothetical protein ABVT39_016282 [Epinephelus coioides]